GTFADGLFDVDGEFQFKNGAILLSAEAGLNVPNFIPLIGGTHLASANFLFQYDEDGGNPQGFFAAWIKLPVIGDAGIEYNIETQTVSLLNNSDIKNLGSGGGLQNLYHTYYETFTLPNGSNPQQPVGATSFSFVVQWINDAGNGYQVELQTPNGATFIEHASGYIPNSYQDGIHANTIWGLTAPAGEVVEGVQLTSFPNPLPTSGKYTLTIESLAPVETSTIVWTALAGYGAPSSVSG